MRELPILFQTEMVEANLGGRKDMTRRTRGLNEINENPDQWVIPHRFHCEKERLTNTGKIAMRNIETDTVLTLKCPYGKAGDVLWVRESFAKSMIDGAEFIYKASHKFSALMKWKPSIHMPKEAARIWLKVVSVKAERAQDISEEDAVREGVEKKRGSDSATKFDYKHYGYDSFNVSAGVSFRTLWEKINGQESWDANPWVWVIEYEVLSTTGKPANLCE